MIAYRIECKRTKRVSKYIVPDESLNEIKLFKKYEGLKMINRCICCGSKFLDEEISVLLSDISIERDAEYLNPIGFVPFLKIEKLYQFTSVKTCQVCGFIHNFKIRDEVCESIVEKVVL